MKKKKIYQLIIFALLSIGLFGAITQAPAQGQNSNPKTSSKMIYHNGPVLYRPQDVYFIFYGCWTNECGLAGDTATMAVLRNFMSTVGSTPYIQINSTYPGADGQAPTGVLIYGGDTVDSSYSHGFELTQSDIEQIIQDHISNGDVPHDPSGIFVLIASGDISSTATGFCIPGAPPFHSSFYFNGGRSPYIFIGGANRCRSLTGPQFLGPGGTLLPTPNGSFAGDAMVANLAHALNGSLTNPFGTGWFDRYGLENADKCTGTFGATYATANGARANFRVDASHLDFLLEQNWVNDRRGRCAQYP